MDIIQQLTGFPLCPELAKQITVYLDKLDHIMLYFVNKQLQKGLKIIFGTRDSNMFTICYRAAKLGYVNILKWAKERGCSLNAETYDIAAKHGHINILSWSRDNDYPWSVWACVNAAEGNHLDALIWLRNNGCPWNKLTCSAAADKGNLEILKWARDNGCGWTTRAQYRAARLGYTDNYPLSGRQIN